MRFICLLFALTIALVTMVCDPAFASSGNVMSPAEVVAIDRARDGSVITVEGEAIGEDLRALGGGRWVNILGDGVGLGIWMPEEMAEKIEYFADYRHSGDVIRVTGVVNIACDEHNGEFDVHARELTVVSRGKPREVTVEPIKGVVGLAGIALAFFLWRSYVWRRENVAS